MCRHGDHMLVLTFTAIGSTSSGGKSKGELLDFGWYVIGQSYNASLVGMKSLEFSIN